MASVVMTLVYMIFIFFGQLAGVLFKVAKALIYQLPSLWKQLVSQHFQKMTVIATMERMPTIWREDRLLELTREVGLALRLSETSGPAAMVTRSRF